MGHFHWLSLACRGWAEEGTGSSEDRCSSLAIPIKSEKAAHTGYLEIVVYSNLHTWGQSPSEVAR